MHSRWVGQRGQFLSVRPANPVPAQAIAQGLAAESQKLGRPRDVTARPQQSLLNADGLVPSLLAVSSELWLRSSRRLQP
jgi:hypothetical protein